MVNRPLSSRRLAGVLLCAFGALSGWIWRQELEWRGGWAGLAWVGYFHWAVPIGGALFVAWATVFADVRRRWLFAVLMATLSVPAYWLVEAILRMQFPGGPMLFASAVVSSDGDMDRTRWILQWYPLLSALVFLLLWPAMPVGLALLARCFGAVPRWKSTLAASALFLLAWPMAVMVRMPLEDLGGHDFIHAVKSGFIVPFLFVALGLPLLSRRQDEPRLPPTA